MRNSKSNSGQHTAVFNIIGVLVSVYEGKNKNYANIRVDGEEINPKTKKPYYSMYKIRFDKSVELPDDGAPVAIAGTVTTYFDKETSTLITYLNGITIS